MANIDILTGIKVVGQLPLDPKRNFKTLADLIDLGVSNVNAFIYHQSMLVMVYENNFQYIWREPVSGSEEGELPAHFVYPANSISDGVDYSGLSYNFFEYNNPPTEWIIFGNPFSLRKGLAGTDASVIQVGDIAMNGIFDANTFIKYMIFTNEVADNDIDNPLNWNIIETI